MKNKQKEAGIGPFFKKNKNILEDFLAGKAVQRNRHSTTDALYKLVQTSTNLYKLVKTSTN